jgi:ribosome-binding protein aMBF1 (putative translation factor)
VKRAEALARHRVGAELLSETIARCERHLDHLLSMGETELAVPRRFFRTDSIIPPPAVEEPPDDPEELGRRIGERIRHERRERLWTQQELADRTGIRRPNIARLERGAGLPNLSTLLKVAVGLELSLGDLIG